MDDTFRLVFATPGSTPGAVAFSGPEALVFATFPQAIAAANQDASLEQPFIAYRHLMFDPSQIALISSQFLSEKSQSESLRSQT